MSSASDGADKALADALKHAKRQPADRPYFFALVLKGAADGRLLVGKRKVPPRPGPCRLAALAYDVSAILTASLDGHVRLHGSDGTIVREWKPEASVAALALDALGTTGYVGLADGNVLALTV